MNTFIKICGLIIVLATLSTVPVSAQEFDEKLDNVSYLLDTGKPDSAAVILYDMVDSITGKQDRVRALYYLAEATGQLGRYAEKKHYLSLACELPPDVEYGDKVRFSYCQLLLDTDDLDGCIALSKDFTQLYGTSPLIPDMLYMAGNAYLEKKEYQRASNVFSDITKNYQASPAAHEAVMKEGVCLFKLEFYTGSIERFEKYLAETPEGQNIDEALYYLGRAYEQNHQSEMASRVFNRLAIEFPSYSDNMEAYIRLGKNLFESGRFIESENAFLNYIANTPENDKNHDEALYYLERIKFKTGQYTSEIQIAENFISKYPESPRTPLLLFDLANYYRMTGQPQEAIENYWVLLNNRLYSAYVDSAGILMADTYVSMNKKDSATSFLIELSNRKKNTATAQNMLLKLGSLYESWTNYDTAIAWYDISLSIDISYLASVRALWGVARCCTQINRWQDAEKAYKRIISDYPKNPYMIDIHMALANMFFQEGRTLDSIHSAEKALIYAKTAQKPDILYFLAQLYEEVDDGHALQLYSQIYYNTRNTTELRNNALLKYAELAERKGDRVSAVNAYTKIISEVADSSSVNKARRKLDSINMVKQ
ncbi:tetratricopeptide repeat protein [bacterium]|nr:tetratricopeptide repeat protein [bacterium]